jgi:hypothetical protein
MYPKCRTKDYTDAKTTKILVFCWVWEPKGQLSEYAIPHGEHCEPCTLRRSYKSTFLLPEEEIQDLINLPLS